MQRRDTRGRSCSYVAILESAPISAGRLRELACYLSTLSTAGCDVVIVDPSPPPEFECHARDLRWVGRQVGVRVDHLVRGASTVALCEKVIVATGDVRYTPEAVVRMCALLEAYEVVEPHDFLDPLPWWGALDAARILVHRGIGPEPDHGATMAFRRSALQALRALPTIDPREDAVRRLAAIGAEVFVANDVFVRRNPGRFGEWLERRPRQASEDFASPLRSAFFFSLAPLFLFLGIVGGLQLAGGYAGIISLSALTLALRGRSGAGAFFPLRTCLFAPIWLLEHSLTVYWALLRKLRGIDGHASVAVPDRSRNTKVASGE